MKWLRDLYQELFMLYEIHKDRLQNRLWKKKYGTK